MLGGAAKISGNPGAEAKEQTWTGAESLGEEVVEAETEVEERRELRRGDDGRTLYAALCVGGGWRGGRVGSEGAVSPPSGALASISVLLIHPHPHFLLAICEGGWAGMEGGLALKDQWLLSPRRFRRCYKLPSNTEAG